MLLADRVKMLNSRINEKHHYSLYKRHLFSDLLDLSTNVVKSYRSDYYCDVLQIERDLPDKPQHSLIIWYAWRDTGTHMWIQNGNYWQMTGRYIHDTYLQYDQYAIMAFVNPCSSSHWDQYVTFYYSVAKG